MRRCKRHGSRPWLTYLKFDGETEAVNALAEVRLSHHHHARAGPSNMRQIVEIRHFAGVLPHVEIEILHARVL